jgi:POT family proton-dependent oligopeptide transporter
MGIEDAMALYGTYTMWVYFTPVIGGFLADRYLGYPLGCC